MREDQIRPTDLTPQSVLQSETPMVLTAALRPVAGLDRFQPAGFPEIGHVIYKAPRKDGPVDNICIVDSPASMANHLESVCMGGPHDPELHDELTGTPYLRCVTGDLQGDTLPPERRELVVTSLTEGHRIASTYFLDGKRLDEGGLLAEQKFAKALETEFGVKLPGTKKAHPPAERWWDVFRTIFRYDPNALVHGVLFPQYQVKIARFLTAHLEAFGAARVDRSGVKFDRLGKTTSGQPIFAVDDATASEIRATFILDVGLLRSFGRTDGDRVRGLSEKQKEFIAALALWKIDRLLRTPFRYRSGCHLELLNLRHARQDAKLKVDIKAAIKGAAFRDGDQPAPIVTDVYWSHEALYREAEDDRAVPNAAGNNTDEGGGGQDGDGEDS
ncbi:MAG: type I-G CRISPR-associated protein Cas7 [Terriglobales bacterium]